MCACERIQTQCDVTLKTQSKLIARYDNPADDGAPQYQVVLQMVRPFRRLSSGRQKGKMRQTYKKPGAGAPQHAHFPFPPNFVTGLTITHRVHPPICLKAAAAAAAAALFHSSGDQAMETDTAH